MRRKFAAFEGHEHPAAGERVYEGRGVADGEQPVEGRGFVPPETLD